MTSRSTGRRSSSAAARAPCSAAPRASPSPITPAPTRSSRSWSGATPRHNNVHKESPMPVTLSYPGVYIEEVPSGVRTITGVATSITAFIGRALRGPANDPTRVQSFAEFERRFGGLARRGPAGGPARGRGGAGGGRRGGGRGRGGGGGGAGRRGGRGGGAGARGGRGHN